MGHPRSRIHSWTSTVNPKTNIFRSQHKENKPLQSHHVLLQANISLEQNSLLCMAVSLSNLPSEPKQSTDKLSIIVSRSTVLCKRSFLPLQKIEKSELTNYRWNAHKSTLPVEQQPKRPLLSAYLVLIG